MKTYYIYSLLKNGSIFYVGLTFNLGARLIGHKRKYGPDIEIKTLEEYFGSKEEALRLEMYWIGKCIEDGVTLSNISKTGGELKQSFTYSCRPEVRQLAMRKAVSEGRTLSDVIEELLKLYVERGVRFFTKTYVAFDNEEYELK